MEQVVRSTVTNAYVAEKIGLTHTQVSRLRTGARKPSIKTMNTITLALGWHIATQMKAIRAGEYAEQFEEFLIRKFPDGDE